MNFDGTRFEVDLELEAGKSKLVLDKFNLYCDAPEHIDMTTTRKKTH